MIADFIMSLSRTLDDKQSNTARIHVIKNRFGIDGVTFPAELDILKGKIEVYDEDSIHGIRARQSMDQSGDKVKELLSEKFQNQQAENKLG